MTACRWVFSIVALAAVLGAVWYLNEHRGPSCEERGGRQVLSGFATINNMVGKVMVPTLVAQYRCEGGTVIAPH